MNRHYPIIVVVILALFTATIAGSTTRATPAKAARQQYNINTLAGKVASVNGTAGLQIRFSAFIEQEAEEPDA